MLAKVVASGSWLYDGIAPTPVRIVELDYDFWYAVGEADGLLEEDERPRLNEQGRLYYVRHRPGWSEGEPFWPDSLGFQSLDNAVAAAQCDVPEPIVWDRFPAS